MVEDRTRAGYQVLRGFTLELRGLLYSNCPVVGSSSGSQSGSAAGLWARPTAGIKGSVGRGGVSGARSDLAASSAARCRSRLSSSSWYAWSRRHSSPRNNSSVPGNCARTAGATAIVTTASISLTRCPSFVYQRCYRSQRNGEPLRTVSQDNLIGAKFPEFKSPLKTFPAAADHGAADEVRGLRTPWSMPAGTDCHWVARHRCPP